MVLADLLTENAVVERQPALQYVYEQAQADILRVAGQGETAAFALYRVHYAGLMQFLHDLSQERAGYPYLFPHSGYRNRGLIGPGHKNQRPRRVIYVSVYKFHIIY